MAIDPTAVADPAVDPAPVADPPASVAADPAPVADPPKEPAAPAAPEAPTVPDKYELALPKDSLLPPAVLDKTAAIARELGLSNEAAQKVLESFNATVDTAAKAEADAWKPGVGSAWVARDAEWRADALKDAEIGGNPDKLAASVNTANLVIAKYGDPTIATFLKDTGLGSKKEFIRMFAKIGRAMSEGSLVTGSTPSGGPKSLEERLYGPKDAAA